jgi:hypothetical protein
MAGHYLGTVRLRFIHTARVNSAPNGQCLSGPLNLLQYIVCDGKQGGFPSGV